MYSIFWNGMSKATLLGVNESTFTFFACLARSELELFAKIFNDKLTLISFDLNPLG